MEKKNQGAKIIAFTRKTKVLETLHKLKFMCKGRANIADDDECVCVFQQYTTSEVAGDTLYLRV